MGGKRNSLAAQKTLEVDETTPEKEKPQRKRKKMKETVDNAIEVHEPTKSTKKSKKSKNSSDHPSEKISEKKKKIKKKKKADNSSDIENAAPEIDISKPIEEEVLTKVLDSTAQPRKKVEVPKVSDDVVMEWAEDVVQPEDEGTPPESRTERATVYVTNIHKDVKEKDLQAIVKGLRDMETSYTTTEPRRIRFTFMQFVSGKTARRALKILDGRLMYGVFMRAELGRRLTTPEEKQEIVPNPLFHEIVLKDTLKVTNLPSSLLKADLKYIFPLAERSTILTGDGADPTLRPETYKPQERFAIVKYRCRDHCTVAFNKPGGYWFDGVKLALEYQARRLSKKDKEERDEDEKDRIETIKQCDRDRTQKLIDEGLAPPPPPPKRGGTGSKRMRMKAMNKTIRDIRQAYEEKKLAEEEQKIRNRRVMNPWLRKTGKVEEDADTARECVEEKDSEQDSVLAKKSKKIEKKSKVVEEKVVKKTVEKSVKKTTKKTPKKTPKKVEVVEESEDSSDDDDGGLDLDMDDLDDSGDDVELNLDDADSDDDDGFDFVDDEA